MDQKEIAIKIKETIEKDPSRDYIQSISLFGSFLHGVHRPDSDIDLLLEMRKTMSLFRLSSVQERLEKSLGKKVDLVEKDSLIEQLKTKIIAESKKIYERGS